MAGELQLGGSTVATHSGTGASAVVTIDNGVKFPAGMVLQTVALSSNTCLLYTSPSPRDGLLSRMPSSA